jgi:hypothetical protein
MTKRNTNNRKTRIYRKKNNKTKGGSTRKFKPMNCSPMVKNKTPIKDSCITPDVLQLLKTSYNKFHKESPILTSNPVEIWKELKQRLKKCNKEDCWLKEIDDENVRKKIDEYIFAPDQPKEWKKKPNEWLSNYDIMDVLKQYEITHTDFHVIGPTPIDFDTRAKDMGGKCVWEELCKFNLLQYFKTGKKKLGIVFNLADHSDGGSHWMSMYVDLHDKYLFYMDSAGNKMPQEIETLVKRIQKQGLEMSPPIHIHFYENCPLEHQMGTTECGMYALYFIITMLTGESEGKKFSNYYEKIAFFKDKRIPDKYVKRLRSVYFNE